MLRPEPSSLRSIYLRDGPTPSHVRCDFIVRSGVPSTFWMASPSPKVMAC